MKLNFYIAHEATLAQESLCKSAQKLMPKETCSVSQIRQRSWCEDIWKIFIVVITSALRLVFSRKPCWLCWNVVTPLFRSANFVDKSLWFWAEVTQCYPFSASFNSLTLFGHFTRLWVDANHQSLQISEKHLLCNPPSDFCFNLTSSSFSLVFYKRRMYTNSVDFYSFVPSNKTKSNTFRSNSRITFV